MINLLEPTEVARINKTFDKGLARYTQANCNVTLTDDGYRIYRPPNIAASAKNTWGGLILQPYNVYNKDMIIKGRTYIILFHVKGKSSNRATHLFWSNSSGWSGGAYGLGTSPTNIEYNTVPENFNGEMDIFYKFTVSDDVYKTCTGSYSSFVAGNSYNTYKEFKFGFDYLDTGSMGTDIYITNIRMYDITGLSLQTDFSKNGITFCNDLMTLFGRQMSIQKYGSILCNDIVEI